MTFLITFIYMRMDSLDLRRTAPADYRYGTLCYGVWTPKQVICNDGSDVYCTVYVRQYQTCTVIPWWGVNRTRRDIEVHHIDRSATQIESWVAYWLGAIVQSTGRNGYLDNHPADPLV
jgi:hypothetical protein